MKKAGIGAQNRAKGAAKMHRASVNATRSLVSTMVSRGEFDLARHQKSVKDARNNYKADRARVEGMANERRADLLGKREENRLKRACNAGIWLTVFPSRLNGTELSAEEFRDSLRLRYGFEPPGLPEKCDGCNCRFTVEHGLSCPVGGLVISRHDDVCLEFGSLAKKALKPSAVSYEPKIRGRSDADRVAATAVIPGSTETDNSDSSDAEVAASDDSNNNNRGDIKIHGFW